MERRRTVFLIGFLSSLAALFLTQSLASLFATVIAICVYLFLIKRMSPGYLIWFGVLAAAAVAAVSLGKEGDNPFEGIQGRLTNVASGHDEGLVTHFHDFQFGIIDNFTLFGQGMGTADFLHSSLGPEMEKRGFPTIEHEYFRLLYEFGGVGFMFYLAAVALTALAAWRFYRMFPDPWRKNLALTCCLWMLLYALVGFAHRSYPTYESSVFPALFLGYLAAEANREEESES
jgi:cell division protein FtsW (lipid II flippase)